MILLEVNTEFIKNEWIPALRSGKYEQGTFGLHVHNTYCCLGVACDLLIAKGILPDWIEVHEPGEFGTVCAIPLDSSTPSYDSHSDSPKGFERSYLPKAACDYIGISYDGIEFELRDEAKNSSRLTSLALANDSGMPFEKIADVLEKFVEDR